MRKTNTFAPSLTAYLPFFSQRCSSVPAEDYESDDCGERASTGETSESTTLRILSPNHRSQIPNPTSEDEARSGEFNGDAEFSEGGQLLCTELHVPSSKENDDEVRRCFSPGDTVELQVSLSEQTLDDVGCASLGSAHGIEGDLSNRDTVEETVHVADAAASSHSAREPLSHRGVVLSSPLMPGQVEVILQQPAASGAGRGLQSGGGTRVRETVGSQSEEEEEEEGQHCEGVPSSFIVSFEIPAEEAAPAEEQDSDGDQDKPNKHRARHASKCFWTFSTWTSLPVCVCECRE